MYLKRLELHGFKTFATRTTLDFEGGVTAVVGPNGSGKSNLADAVRWALGEQSMRNVRCRRAEDLIFAGTAGARGARSPMGMAEVLITFDNTSGWLPVEFAEVRVGRRVYRTGENEYVMNGAQVRLRDITDLLVQAAVSTNGHLIIGQGLVDTVLGVKPEERRVLIENLAGLRHYYTRRDDAESKLRATETNMQSVAAMIAEATPHLALLREQASAYASYHALEQELRSLLVLHYAAAFAAAHERQEQASAALSTTTDGRTALGAAVESAEAAGASARARVSDLGRDLAAVRGTIREAHAAREEAERRRAVNGAQHDAAAARLDELRKASPLLESRRGAAAVDAEAAAEAAHEAARSAATLEATRREVEELVANATAAATAAEAARRRLDERRRGADRDLATIQADLAALQRETDAAQGAEARQSADLRATTKGLADATAALSAARAALDKAMSAVETTRTAEAQARVALGDAADKARTAASERLAAEKRDGDLRARASGLRAWLQAAGGGKDDGVTVAATLLTDPNTAGALASALGTMLGARRSTPDLDAARAGAVLAGGARGLLLPGAEPIEGERQMSLWAAFIAAGIPETGLVGWGDALARDGDARDGSVRAALSRVLVVRDLDTLWALRPLLLEANPALHLAAAALSGEALTPLGLLTRGEGDGAAALQRSRELHQVEQESSSATEALAEKTRLAGSADAARTARAAAADESARALRAAEHERTVRRAEATAAERAEAQARRESQWAAEQARKATEQIQARGERQVALAARRKNAERTAAALQNDEGPLIKQLDTTRTALQDATRRQSDHRAELSVVGERRAAAERRQRTTADDLARLDVETRDHHERMTAAERDEAAIQARGVQAGSALEAATRSLTAAHEKARPLEGELVAIQTTMATLDERLAQLRKESVAATAAYESAALAHQKAVHDVEALSTNLQNDLALDPRDLPLAAPLPPGMSSRIKALRAGIAAAGPVNARAPTDLEAAAERQAFLEAQAADLRDGVARLRAVIAEANATLHDRFAAVTAELDAQFRVYVQHLFAGGKGELTPLFDERGLPSGLDIAVQPPGKRTRDLALLSGGERALVGLALVFAMLAVRPLPFCVLDEAEASLDEANTLRVGEILRDLSTKTQFIIITHNRGTMSHADTLYGVTMAESGLSQVAGIRLEDVELVRPSRAG